MSDISVQSDFSLMYLKTVKFDRLESKVVEKRASGELVQEPWTERPFQVTFLTGKVFSPLHGDVICGFNCMFSICFKRDIPDLTADVEETYHFPSNDEQFGMVYMGWRVPGNPVKNMQKRFEVVYCQIPNPPLS